jgi:signal transduction histidine kinase
VTSDTGVYVLPRGARRFTRRTLPPVSGERTVSIQHLSQALDGSIWGVSRDLGLLIVADSAGAPPAADALRYRARGFRAATFDARGDAWLTGDSKPAVRVSVAAIRRPDGRGRTDRAPAAVADTFATSASLGGAIKRGSVLEDREGSLWFGSSGGLDQLREARITPVRWLSVGGAPALAAGDTGSMWLASFTDSPSLAVGDRLVAHPEVPSPVTHAYRDRDGGTWMGGPHGLWHRAAGGSFSPVPLPAELVDGPVFGPPRVVAIARDGEGTLWLATMQYGLFRRRRGAWARFGPQRPAARVVVADEAGRTWIGYMDGHIARVTGDGGRDVVRRYAAADGLRINTVVALHVRGDRVWASGEVGVASLDASRADARFVPLTLAAGAPRGVSGIVETPDGELWLNTAEGVVRVPEAELRRAHQDTTYRARSEVFDYRDGVDGQPSQGVPLPSAVAGSDGRLWFATEGGAAWVDPRQLRRNVVPPPVRIRTLDAGGQSYPDTGRLALPSRTTALRVAYTAYSLAVPERVRFRYRLVGLDTAWQDAGARREAFYTNLRPGAYRFEVRAANDDGVWATAGAALDVVIPPTFVQTPAFLALCLMAGGGTLWSLGAWRQRRLSAAARARAEAVLAERLRLARELHDTLLSDVAGVAMQLDAVTTTPARGDVEAIVAVVAGVRDQARRALDDARRAVVGLRTEPDAPAPLEARLADAAQRIFARTDVAARVDVTSALPPLAPAVDEAVYRIVTEAMVNARTHAGCTTVVVTCGAAGHDLALGVRDDGRGFDPTAAAADGHYGLVGMRERAATIGARLTIESAAGRGSEVRLVVPARAA